MAATADTAQIIRCVSESLRTLIRNNIAELQADSAVVFESPAEIEGTDETRLSLYLYQIEVNRYLRNLPATPTRVARSADRPASLAFTPAPLVVDLLYMMVPYAKTGELELVIIDRLVSLLETCGALPNDCLHSVLLRTGNDSLEIVPEITTFHTLRDIWAGFPQKSYRLTKLYTVSPVRIPSSIDVAADLVGQGDMHSALQRAT
jgi:hypothetical protein